MTKLFTQLFLSAMVAFGAAAGFNPHMKDKVVETLSEAKALAHEAARSTLETIAWVGLNGDASVSASVEADASASAQADAQTKADGNAVLDFDGLSDGAASANGSLSAESQTDVSLESRGFGFNLSNAINSALGFGE